MLFAIDVGNTNITMGLFDGEKLEKTFRMTTGISRTSDEFGVFLGELLRMRNLPLDVIDEVIIASVVPNVMHSLTNGIRKYFKLDPLIVEPGVKTGINITIPNPRQLGADRIVDAVAAYHMYGGPVLVIDFGTATTYDLVNGDGSFIAGVTSHYGAEQRSCRKLRSRCRIRYCVRIRSPVCRQVYVLAISDRQNTL